MTSMHASPMKEVGITKPIPFNGDRRQTKAFIQECNVYLDINEEIYWNDKLKVAFVLSLMNEKEALTWRGHYINSITNKQLKITYPTIAEFLTKLETNFKPVDMAGEAMNKLELLQQGKWPVESLNSGHSVLKQSSKISWHQTTDTWSNCLQIALIRN